MLVRTTDVVDDQIIVGDAMALFGVVPKLVHVRNHLAIMIHKRVSSGMLPQTVQRTLLLR